MSLKNSSHKKAQNGVAKTPSKPLFVDIAGWAEHWEHKIALSDDSVQAFATSMNIPFRVSKSSFVNLHSISHLCRDEFIRQTLIREGRGKHKLVIVDYFGSKRNLKFDPSLAGPRTWINNLDSRNQLKISWHSCPNLYFAGDAARGIDHRVDYPSEQIDFAIVQDVYDGLTPLKLLRLLSKTNNRPVYICNRMFLGLAGADCSSSKVEQVWIRVDSKILSKPEPQMACYAPHVDTNWLLFRTVRVERMDISLANINVLGPYHTFRACLEMFGTVINNNVTIPDGKVVEVKIECKTSFPGLTNSELCKVHVATAMALRLQYALRIPSGHVLDSGLIETERTLNLCPEMRTVKEFFPEYYHDILRGTFMSVLYHSRSHLVQRLMELRRDGNLRESTLVSVRAPKNAFEPITWFKNVFLFLFLVFCSVLGWVLTDQPASFIIQYPVCSAVLEEILRSLLPFWGMWIMILLEFFRNFSRNNKGIRVLILHVLLQLLSNDKRLTVCRFLLHILYNHLSKNSCHSRVIQFLQSYEQGQWMSVMTSRFYPLPNGLELPSLNTRAMELPKDFVGQLKVRSHYMRIPLRQALELEEINLSNNLYPILITDSLMFAPSRTDRNLLVSLLWRLHKNPFSNVDALEIRCQRWRKLGQVMIRYRLFDGKVPKLLTLEECAKLQGSKGKRLLLAYGRYLTTGDWSVNKNVFVKTDETLRADKILGNSMSLKPRCIVSFDPTTLAIQASMSRALADLFHLLWDGKMYSIDGFPVALHFASGYDQNKLNDLGRQMLSGQTVIAFAGDDSVVAWGALPINGNTFVFGESDQTQFDSTQDHGVLLEFTPLWMKYLQVPDWFIDLYLECVKKPYAAFGKNFKINGKIGPFMPTGIGLTTVLNSISTLSMYIYCIRNRQRIGIADAGAELGFKVKYKGGYDLSDITFLKGWWLPAFQPSGISDILWLPLPSLVLKIGKVSSHPEKCLGRYASGNTIARLAFAISHAYQNIPYDYPILGWFLNTLGRLGEPFGKPMNLKIFESYNYRKIVINLSLDFRHINRIVCKRYNLAFQDLVRLERLMGAIDTLPALIEDPIFRVLVNVDY